jgi:hypothetical protein
MTLKEKINDAQFYIEPKTTIIKLEQIADEFAIGFGEWCLKIKFEPIENISVKKLLEIYKKEKGL